MTTLTPSQLALIRGIEGIALTGFTYAISIIMPALSSKDTINWTQVGIAFVSVFSIVLLFGVLEYSKQSLQQQVAANEKTGTSSIDQTAGIGLITQAEAALGAIATHLQTLTPLLSGLTNIISAQQTTVLAPAQVLSTPNVPEVVNLPVSSSAYDVSAVSSTTGMVPIVQAPASPAQTL